MKRFGVVLGLVAIVLLGCSQQIAHEEFNWHEQGLATSEFIATSITLPDTEPQAITAYLADGFVKFQGDILLGETSTTVQATYVAKLWENNTIPYTIDPAISAKVRKHIRKAIQAYNKETTLKWIEWTNENDYVEFRASSYCASYVGRKGGRQPILLADYCSYSAVLHEMGHALGFQHEQTRPDRDEAVTIHWQHIPSLWRSQYKIIKDAQTYRNYDYYSIMHYPAYFGKKLVIEPKLEFIKPKKMGYRKVFSKRDMLGIAFLYPERSD